MSDFPWPFELPFEHQSLTPTVVRRPKQYNPRRLAPVISLQLGSLILSSSSYFFFHRRLTFCLGLGTYWCTLTRCLNFFEGLLKPIPQSVHTYGLTSLLFGSNQLDDSVLGDVVHLLTVHVNGKIKRAVELLSTLLTPMVPAVLSASVAELTENSKTHLIPKWTRAT